MAADGVIATAMSVVILAVGGIVSVRETIARRKASREINSRPDVASAGYVAGFARPPGADAALMIRRAAAEVVDVPVAKLLSTDSFDDSLAGLSGFDDDPVVELLEKVAADCEHPSFDVCAVMLSLRAQAHVLTMERLTHGITPFLNGGARVMQGAGAREEE